MTGSMQTRRQARQQLQHSGMAACLALLLLQCAQAHKCAFFVSTQKIVAGSLPLINACILSYSCHDVTP